MSVPTPQRREAADILARTGGILAQRVPLPRPAVRRLGLLMLVPAA